MWAFEDLMSQVDKANTAPTNDAPVENQGLTADVFKQTEAQTKLESPKQWAVAGFVEGLWGIAKATVDWVWDKKDHWIDNEDEDLWVTDWNKFKAIDDDIKTGQYNQKQIDEKLQRAKQEGVISEEYFAKQRRDANSVAAKATSEQELEQKIKKDLYSQLAEYYAAESGDQATVRILNQAIETQTDTYMDYYRRISSSDEAFDKEKYYSDLAKFMEQGKWFIKNYAESVMATRDNKLAYKEAESKNMEFIQEMDNWNTKLTTRSKLASLRWAASGLFDSEFDGIGWELGNLWWTATGILWAITNLISVTTHEGKKLANIYNSGFEELSLDYIQKPTDSWSRVAFQTLKQGGLELVDGFDTFLEAVLPIVPVAKLWLLSKVENAARLTKTSSFWAKAASYSKSFWVQMFQDAVYFDNAFQAFSQRWANEQDREFNVMTNIAFNSVFSLLLSKPILRWSQEFRMFIESTGKDASYFASTPDVLEAFNKWDTKTAEALIRKNILKSQDWEDVAVDTTITLTDKARKQQQAAINKISNEMKAITEDVTSDEAFKAQKYFNNAMEERLPTVYATKSEMKRLKQDSTFEEALNTLLWDKAINGKYTYAMMLNSPESQALIRQAVDQAMKDSSLAAGTKLEMTDAMATKLYNTLIDLKSGIQPTKSLGTVESQHMLQIAQNISDLVKNTEDVSKLFPPDVVIPAKLTTKKSILQTEAPTYEEMAKQLKKLDEPTSYSSYLAKKIDQDFMDVHVIDTLLPQNWDEFVVSLRAKIIKHFWDEETWVVDLAQIKQIVDDIPSKKYLTDKELDALKFYHLWSTYTDFERLKQITLTRDVSDKKLFQSHPFFSLFTKDTENNRWIPNAVLTDARNINDAIGKMFMKAPVTEVEKLPLFQWVLTDNTFKAKMIKYFREVTSKSSKDTGENIWSLVKYLYMDPKTALELERQFVQNKEVWTMLLGNYIEGVVARDPILEGAYYASWLSKLPAKPFFVSQPYAEYAKNFQTYINDVVLKDLPKWMDKTKFVNIMYAKWLDEVIKLNQIDYDLGLQILTRSSVSKEIQELENLKLSILDETLELSTRTAMQQKINILESTVRGKFNIGQRTDTAEKIKEALLSMRNNPSFTKKFDEVLPELNTQSLITSTTAVSFEKARKDLIKAVSQTSINAEDYIRVQQFLMIPRSLIEKWRADYLKAIESWNILDIDLYTKWVISRNLLAWAHNIEDAYSRIQDVVAKYKSLPETKAERILAFKDKSTDPFDLLPAKSIINRKPIDLADLKGKKGVVIIWRAEMDKLDRGEIIPGVKSWSNFKFVTLFELQGKELSPGIKSWYNMKDPASAKKFYADFRERYGDFYMTENALENYIKAYKRDKTFVAKDTAALDIIKQNFQGSTISILPINISLRADKSAVDMFITSKTDDLLAIRDNDLFYKDTVKEKIDPVLQKEMFSRGTLENFLYSWASGAKTVNIFDQLFQDSDLAVFWSTIKKDIKKTKHIDILKYWRGSDFQDKYAAHISLFGDIVESKFKGSSEYPWFKESFQMSEDEFLNFSRAHLLADDTGKTTVSFAPMFGEAIQRNILNKLVDLKDPKNISVRRFITFNMLNIMMRGWYTVPKMPAIDLLRLVDKLDYETIAVIWDAGRYLLNPERLKSAVNKTDMQEWVAKIEQSLKYDSSLKDQIINWWVAGTMDISKVVDAGESDVAMDVLKSIPDKDTETVLDLWRSYKDSPAQRRELEGLYPEIFNKTETDDEILDASLGYSSSWDFSAIPMKLENADTIEVFEWMGKALQTIFDDITATLYLKRFTPYQNLDRGKNFPLDINQDLLKAYENIFNEKVSELYVDANKYLADPLEIDKDFKSVDFYVSLGKENIKITSKEETKDLLLKHWYEVSKLPQSQQKKLMMNFYALPKDSPLKPSEKGFLAMKDKNFIALDEISHVDSYLEWGKTFKNSPLFKWAFSKEILDGNTTFIGLVEQWATKTKAPNFKERLEIFNELKRQEWFDSPVMLDLFEDATVDKEFIQALQSEVKLPPGEAIDSIELINYKPVIAVTDTEDSFKIVRTQDSIFSRDTDIDNALNNLWEVGPAQDITSLDDLLENGKIKINTTDWRTIMYEYGKITEYKKPKPQEIQPDIIDEWSAYNKSLEDEFDFNSWLIC